MTHRDHATSFAIVTGHGREEKGQDFLNWPALATGIDTIAFYMGVGNLPYICEQLIKHGRNPHTQVALIEWGTTEKQRTVTGTLEDIVTIAETAKVAHPAIVLIGDVVGVREAIRWFE